MRTISGKKLSEMSLEELWQLFPIVLRDHDLRYAEWYTEEKMRILQFIRARSIYRISHIGSTAVPGLRAKPIVDILLETREDVDRIRVARTLETAGFLQMSLTHCPDLRISMNKGYTPDGFAEKVYHLHLRQPGDWGELYFRDYLRAHPDAARAYGELEDRLGEEYRHDRDGYTQAKTAFVQYYTEKARTLYNGRYRPEKGVEICG